ncbi:MAG: hypothetical protein Q7U10_03305 [Thermodesulfovibrionia bacterium]|nr:hypothetical protein [Thermodesulfovibrionia bacterium]
MKIGKILGEELSSSVKEIRQDTHNYAELVFFSKDISNWHQILSGKFGHPVILEDRMEPEGPVDNALQEKTPIKVLSDYIGGVREGQSIYYGTHDASKVLIMMWPWKDKNHVTLKKLSYNEDILNADERRIYQRRALRERRRMGSSLKPKCPNRRYRTRRVYQERRFMPLLLIQELNKMSVVDNNAAGNA